MYYFLNHPANEKTRVHATCAVKKIILKKKTNNIDVWVPDTWKTILKNAYK